MKKIIHLILLGIITPLLLSLLTVCDDAMLQSMQDEVTVLISEWSYFSISDTGQDIDTDSSAVIGEDADHGELPAPSFTANADGTITDNVTPLVWMKCSLGENGQADTSETCTDTHGIYSWQDALDACKNMDYAGSTSWRVPTVTEFFSIFNFRGRNRDESAVDSVFNERDYDSCSTPDYDNAKDIIDIGTWVNMKSNRRYWTSSTWPKTTSGKTYIWTLNAFDGHLNVNDEIINKNDEPVNMNAGAPRELYVRCVRSK